jgi:hypothetical protein
MPVVQADCPRCGTVRVDPHQVRVNPPDTVRFQCPVCHNVVVISVKDPIIKLLEQVGVRIGDSPITSDDLIAFHEHLDEEIEQLERQDST